MAEPRHPASEEAPRVAHRSANPEISATRLRERGAELHVRHRGEHGHDEVQAERQDERRTRDPEAGPDEQKDRRPDRRAEPDHRDFQEPEVPAKFDLDLAALCHRVAAEWESLISPSNSSRDALFAETAGNGPVPSYTGGTGAIRGLRRPKILRSWIHLRRAGRPPHRRLRELVQM